MRLPLLRWRDEWRQPGAVRADLMAGLTGAIVVLPQGVAFATLAGMPPQYGLYAAMVPCIVAAMFGSSRLMVTGPANAISLTTMALIAPLAAVGSPQYVSLVLTLTFLVGALQLLLGLARAGSLVDKVPHSVVVGFTAGAAVLIANSQIGPLLGIALPRGTNVFENLQQAAVRLEQTQALALLAGVSTMVLAVVARPLNRIVPAMLVASRNDPWMAFDHSRQLAQSWGAELYDIGHAGHVNAASGFGPWPKGKAMRDDLLARTARPGMLRRLFGAGAAPAVQPDHRLA